MKDNKDGTVTDGNLMWQKETTENTMTWNGAVKYCKQLNLGNYTDWRLPTIKELKTLVVYDRYCPAINIEYFPETILAFYWSYTSYASIKDCKWGVDFYNGLDNYHYESSSYYIRAVRGGI